MSITENHGSMNLIPEGYGDFLKSLKQRIKETQLKAAIAVNRDLILLYWDIGRQILERQDKEGWGAKIIDRLAADLKHEFPGMKGFSPRNLKYMRKLAAIYPDIQIVQQAVAQIPWGHIIRLLELVTDAKERDWYIYKTIENGWSRDILVLQIENHLYQRQGKGISNFPKTLPPPQSDLARQTLKDPYIFDFLMLEEDAEERDIERQLTYHITQFLLELGAGFAFVGRQYHLEISGKDYYIDLLAEYALRDINKPIGVSNYQLTKAIPEELKSSLPSIEELEIELAAYLKKH